MVTWTQAQPQLLAIRYAVFVDEQQVPAELEQDGLDPICEHVIAQDEEGAAIGTGRLFPDGRIGRMAVLKPWRNRGVGSLLLGALLDAARRRGLTQASLHAQVGARHFYQRHGFVVTSDVYVEAGIDHVDMTAAL